MYIQILNLKSYFHLRYQTFLQQLSLSKSKTTKDPNIPLVQHESALTADISHAPPTRQNNRQPPSSGQNNRSNEKNRRKSRSQRGRDSLSARDTKEARGIDREKGEILAEVLSEVTSITSQRR